MLFFYPQCKKQVSNHVSERPKKGVGTWLKVQESPYIQIHMDHGSKGQLQNPQSPSSFHTISGLIFFPILN
jgi:hypothetical protein